MELSWLEDLIALHSSRSFSKAAEIRHVTQPTLSRRIQSLEIWLGAPLIDRRVFPIVLTEQGKSFIKASEDIVQSLYRERDICRGVTRPVRGTMSFAMVQSIATDFFPDWIKLAESKIGPLKLSVASRSLHDCVQALIVDSCDLMLAYASKGSPQILDASRFQTLTVLEDLLVPVCAVDEHGSPAFALPEVLTTPIPYLAYSSYASLSGAVSSIIEAHARREMLDQCYESDLASALKSMALSGRGVAWLPHFSVKAEIADGLLAVAGSMRWAAPIQVNAYRAIETRSQDEEALWAWMQAHPLGRNAMLDGITGPAGAASAVDPRSSNFRRDYPSMSGRRTRRR
ncbi:LysR family transcriptional regulator [Xylophilus rhododendri]|nr:LysR family transcriptional regulator [Xylophilus rhododendri]